MVKVPEDLLDNAEDYFKITLNKKSDLILLINAFNLDNGLKGFEDFCFTGKYLFGLFRVLNDSSNIPEVKSVDPIKKDIADNVEKIKTQLKSIIIDLDETNRNRMEKDYLGLSQNSLQNLQALFEDINYIKKYLNFLKRTNSN
jgi:hypothetical protein